MYILIMLTVLKLHLVYQIKLSDFCSFCCLGKAHRLPSFHPLYLTLSLLNSFFVICGDYSSRVFFLTCVDAYSPFNWIFPLKLKSHTLQSFKTSKELLNYNINSSIKSVQTVWGGEFRPFITYLNNLGWPAHTLTTKMDLLKESIDILCKLTWHF